MSDKPTGKSMIEGTLAQALGGAVAVLVVTTMASYEHYMPAGFESAFGTVLAIGFYLGFKNLRKR